MTRISSPVLGTPQCLWRESVITRYTRRDKTERADSPHTQIPQDDPALFDGGLDRGPDLSPLVEAVGVDMRHPGLDPVGRGAGDVGAEPQLGGAAFRGDVDEVGVHGDAVGVGRVEEAAVLVDGLLDALAGEGGIGEQESDFGTGAEDVGEDLCDGFVAVDLWEQET
jgi:hypothetical protein